MSMSAFSGGAGAMGRRLVWTNLATASIALVVASFCLAGFQFFSLRTALLHDLVVQTRIVADNATAALRFRDATAAAELLGALRGSPSVMAATFFDAESVAFESYVREREQPMLWVPIEMVPRGHRFSLRDVELVEPVQIDGATIGHIAVRADLDRLYSQLAGFATATLLVGAGALGLSFLLMRGLRRAVHQAERRLAHLAHVDPVTGLSNRHSYREQIEAAAKRVRRGGGRFGLLLLDLDNFKAVNDTLGHAGGDELLKLVGQRLAHCVRSGDAVCRIGGDEFAIIVHAIDYPANAASVAANLVKGLARPFRVDDHDLWITGSVGVTVYPDDASDLATLLRNADTAMYAAKSAGRNTFRAFEPEMNAEATERFNLESDLRRALDADMLEVHYQPQLDVATGRVKSVEALVRWTHPVRGDVSPAVFIPVAERSGLIAQLGRFVLRQACDDAAAWNRGRTEPLAIAVNLSAHELIDQHLVPDVASILAEAALNPRLLEIEITESVLMENMEVCMHTLQQLRDRGVRIAIDDFGTGYSSMAYLRRLPVNRLKIDRAFVHDLRLGAGGRELTAAIIAMAHALKLDVVAEGVEDLAQKAILEQQGCDVLQGYLISRPLPYAGLAAWLAGQDEAGRMERTAA